MPGLGRLVPTDFEHVEKFPLRGLAPATFPTAARVLPLAAPVREGWYNQGQTSACVGFSLSGLMSCYNNGRRYDAAWLWRQARLHDEWTGNDNLNQDAGTSVRAGCDILRTVGHVWNLRGKDQPVNPREGILENRWITATVDLANWIVAGQAAVLGLDWFDAWMDPSGDTLPAPNPNHVAGGHAILVHGWDPTRRAFRLRNSWGNNWGDRGGIWLPEQELARQLTQAGEVVVVTDKPSL